MAHAQKNANRETNKEKAEAKNQWTQALQEMQVKKRIYNIIWTEKNIQQH